MFESERDFLFWLGGYFDHGSCCRVTERIYRGYPVLSINIAIYVDSNEMAAEIRDFFSFEGAKLKESNKPRKRYVYEIRAIPEALSFAYQLMPYVKIRTTDLEKVIGIINKWIDSRIESNIYKAGAREMVERVLDVRCMKLAGKLNHHH